MKKQTVDLLRRLTETDGVPGFESEIAGIIRSELKGVAHFDTDNLGSLICTHKGQKEHPVIMVPAHMDEIGMMVKDVDESGCLRFAPLGGWMDQTLLGHVVTVKTKSGDIQGIIGCKPPHLIPREERNKVIKMKEMFIDVGAKDKEDAQKKLRIRIGDPIVPRQGFARMKNDDRLMAKAWDDRVGCGILIELMKQLARVKHPNTVCGVGTVQEEVGTRGAETAADVVNPDFCIVLDVGLATDMPGVEKEVKAELGKGPIIYVLDAGTIIHHRFKDLAVEVAEKKRIPHQLSLMEGGATDARAIHLHKRGVPSIELGIPTRYIHSHAGIIDSADFDATLKLTLEIIKALAPAKARQILG